VVLKNNGETEQPRSATVTGVQGEVEIYKRSQNVSAPLTRGKRGSATFPPYTPTALGLIRWTIVIADDVPEGSTAQAATEVLAPKGRSAAGAGAGVVNDDEEHDDEEQEAN